MQASQIATVRSRYDEAELLQLAVNLRSSQLLDCLIPEVSKRRKMTLATYLIKIARLGGYLARTKDSPPGNMVMWRGLSRLTDIELGFLLGAQVVGN